MNARTWILLSIVFLLPAPVLGHVGSPDIFYEGDAGPYRLLVTIRPPANIPGLAQIEVRSLALDVNHLEAVPLAVEASDSQLAPQPDVLPADKDHPDFFSGNLWIMLRGSWKLEIAAYGKSGKGVLAVPLPAVATSSAHMSSGMGGILAAVGLLLVFGLLRIVHAANGEAELPAGQELTAARDRRAYKRAGFALVLTVGILFFGKSWWDRESMANAATLYRIPHLAAELREGNVLLLHLDLPGLPASQPLSREMQPGDLLPDHGHLLHLFLIRMPEMDSFWHLHPTRRNTTEFAADLPEMPAGNYKVYADIVYQNGFPETQVGSVTLPAIAGKSLSGDDSGNATLKAADASYELPDGYRMIWQPGAQALSANQPIAFRFRLEDSNGSPASDCENYMGMAGHAVFVSDGGNVLAHVHPQGSVSMAALALVQAGSGKKMEKMDKMEHTSHVYANPEVSFPYGFPRSGNYHIFVQMKRSGHVETAVFAAHVH